MTLEDTVNDRFEELDTGFVGSEEAPAMTVLLTAAQMVVEGSTICLIC